MIDATTSMGGVQDETPATLGRHRNVLVLRVFDEHQLQDVVLAPGGALEGLQPGSVLISHTTGSPAAIERIDAAAERDVAVLDAAFSGGAHDIEAGQLTVLAGGTDEVLARARPVLDAWRPAKRRPDEREAPRRSDFRNPSALRVGCAPRSGGSLSAPAPVAQLDRASDYGSEG